MYLEKNYSPGHIINLDHVASMNWDIGLSVEFIMANGQAITWEYENEDDLSEDQNLLADGLHKAGLYMSVDKDQE
ncbi:MAG: hypothetical protein HOD11_01430 [Candidatus Marinimicrobia bacterium]|jgi:hypothetical protein|nr:hypothetical protein [Candidatus Neomarinimicrobiota bacterium]MBT4034338.1 hypothetical protein [Candidatus Neomarinimicrobiota bacterium]MBT4359613.1 hypothetical protein [Candidatus Neomarinimicrobiota bacterium]MBT4420869.1 hypothetical protein [Candidatus Neomarinimicrobiota bacterium]MBT4992381.1 hypothetical protein [Candidatus Neomarinimicrobiota bacterium]